MVCSAEEDILLFGDATIKNNMKWCVCVALAEPIFNTYPMKFSVYSTLHPRRKNALIVQLFFPLPPRAFS